LALQLGCKLEESRLGEGRNEAHIFDLVHGVGDSSEV
jgi:hypothetical protein